MIPNHLHGLNPVSSEAHFLDQIIKCLLTTPRPPRGDPKVRLALAEAIHLLDNLGFGTGRKLDYGTLYTTKLPLLNPHALNTRYDNMINSKRQDVKDNITLRKHLTQANHV